MALAEIIVCKFVMSLKVIRNRSISILAELTRKKMMDSVDKRLASVDKRYSR